MIEILCTLHNKFAVLLNIIFCYDDIRTFISAELAIIADSSVKKSDPLPK